MRSLLERLLAKNVDINFPQDTSLGKGSIKMYQLESILPYVLIKQTVYIVIHEHGSGVSEWDRQ